MRVLPSRINSVVTAVLSLILLASSNFACWSQLVHPVSPEECCAKGACNRMPAHSSCKVTPANTDRLAPVVFPAPAIILAVGPLVSSGNRARIIQRATRLSYLDYSPPELFLVHSAFLI